MPETDMHEPPARDYLAVVYPACAAALLDCAIWQKPALRAAEPVDPPDGPGGGILAVKHKVMVTPMDAGAALLPVIPPETLNAAKTPLIVDTADSPFDLRTARPVKTPDGKSRNVRPTQRIK